MKIINSYIKGFSRAMSLYKMITVIYFATLILALSVVFPFRNAFSNAVAHSMLPEKLLNGFNFTIFEDFIRNNGNFLFPFLQIIFWFGVAYLFFSIFFSGGILSTFYFEKNKFSMQTFFEGCGKFFLRFFRVMIFTILLNIFFALIVYLPLSVLFDIYSDSAVSERDLFFIGITGVFVHLLLIILSLIISDYTKIKIVTEDTNKVFKTFWQSVKFTFKHLLETYFLYLLLLLFPLILFLAYYFFEKPIELNSLKIILTMFFIQQFFIWLRIFSKVWFLRSELYYYKNFWQPKQEEEKEKWDLKDLINPDEILDDDLIT